MSKAWVVTDCAGPDWERCCDEAAKLAESFKLDETTYTSGESSATVVRACECGQGHTIHECREAASCS